MIVTHARGSALDVRRRRLHVDRWPEGIETVAQQDRLQALGCDFGQGFLFARPLEADAAGRIVADAPDWLPRSRHLSAVS